MANTLNVAEFAEIAIGPAGRVGQIPMMPAITTYNLGTGTASAFFDARTRLLRLNAQTGAVCYRISTAGTAAAVTDIRLAANQTEYVGVIPGGTYKVATIDST